MGVNHSEDNGYVKIVWEREGRRKLVMIAQIQESKLKTGRGRVIDIGHFQLLPSDGFPYNLIPLLHYVVTQKNDEHGGYVSSCIEMQMDGYGKTKEDAVTEMIEHVRYYLKRNFDDDNKKNCWSNLLDLFTTSPAYLWDVYNAFVLMQAERGFSTKRYL